MRNAQPVSRGLVGAVVVALVCLVAVAGPAGAAGPPKGAELDVSNCAWPNFTDGRITGFGFNDRNAGYRATPMFTGLPGGHWRFRGRYPHARWISFESYDRTLSSQDSISGTTIDPDDHRLTSPYVAGGTARPGDAFTVDMYDEPPARRDAAARNVLYGGYRGNPTYGGLMREESESVIYRVYDAPEDVDTFGGVPAPRMYWVVDDPARNPFASADDACASLGLADAEYQPWPTIISSLEALNHPVLKPIVVPAAQLMQVGLPSRNGQPQYAVFRPSSNGYQNLYFNSRTPYFGFSTNQPEGPLVVVHFKAPTYWGEGGHAITGDEQVAYWDWCSTQFLTPLNYTLACRRDEQFHPDAGGYVTLVVSTPKNRPVVDGRPYPDWLTMAGNGGLTVMRELDSNRRTFPESPFFLDQRTLGDVDLPADLLPGSGSRRRSRRT